MSKAQKSILFFLFFLLIPVYGYYFYRNQQDLKIQNREEAQEKLTKEMDQKMKQNMGSYSKKKIKGNENVEVYYPTDKDGKTIPLIEAQINEIVKTTPKKSNEPSKIFIGVKRTQDHKNIDNYAYTYDEYYWNEKKEQWNHKEKPLNQHTVLNSLTSQPIHLDDVLKNDPRNLLQLTAIARTDLLENQQEYKEHPDKIFELTRFKPEEEDIQLTPDQLIIKFPPNDLGLTAYQIPYERIGQYLNPDFVDETYIKEAPENQLDPNKKYIALTFDDGPSDKTTPKVLEILKSQNVPATFFMLGQQVERFPQIAKQIKDEGHELGDHSYSHPNLVELSEEEIRNQIENTEIAIYKATGALPKTVRPPYGSVNTAIAPIIGLPISQWSIDSLDWKTHNAQKITTEIRNHAFNGGIVLMHDIHPETVEALPTVINNLRKDGYEFLTLSQILRHEPLPLTEYYSYDDSKVLQ